MWPMEAVCSDPRKRGCEGTAGRAGGTKGLLRESGPRRAGVQGSRKKGLLLGKEVPLLLSWEQRFSFWDNKGIQRAKNHQPVSWCNRWGQPADGIVPSLFTSQHFLDSCCVPGLETTETWPFPIRTSESREQASYQTITEPAEKTRRRQDAVGNRSRCTKPASEG